MCKVHKIEVICSSESSLLDVPLYYVQPIAIDELLITTGSHGTYS